MNATQTFIHRGSALLLTLTLSHWCLANDKLFIPSHPQARAPLFVDLHGCLSSPEAHEQATGLSLQAEKHGFYVLYPEVINSDLNKGCFDFYTRINQQRGRSDGRRIISKINELIATYDIDPEKVYVLGMSAGASMVSLLISCYPEVFKGAAIHSGMAYGLAKDAKSSLLVAQTGPIPLFDRADACSPKDFKGRIFIVHGSRDQIMSPLHYRQLKEDFVSDLSVDSELVAPLKYQYSYLVEKFYNQQNDLRGEGVFVLGMNHEWSGSKPRLPGGPRGPDVTPMIVDFFLRSDDPAQ